MKRLFLVFIFLGSVSYSAERPPMPPKRKLDSEQVAEKRMKIEDLEKQDYISALPADVRRLIITILTRATTLEEAATAIRNLSMTNRAFYTIINDEIFTKKLINDLVNLGYKSKLYREQPGYKVGEVYYQGFSPGIKTEWLPNKKVAYIITMGTLHTHSSLELLKRYLTNPVNKNEAICILVNRDILQNKALLDALLKVAPLTLLEILTRIQDNPVILKFVPTIERLLKENPSVEDLNKVLSKLISVDWDKGFYSDEQLKKIELLLNTGANKEAINQVDYGKNPLMINLAKSNASPEIIEYFLKLDVNPNALAFRENKTALDIVKTKNRIDLLKQYGAKHAHELEGHTVSLIQAIESKYPLDSIQKILDNGADVNHGTAKWGNKAKTPLMHAVTQRPANIALINLLLERGADPNMVYITGSYRPSIKKFTALDMAKDPEVIKLLRSKGAKAAVELEK